MSEVNGGFFVELGLKTNKDSFESGKKAIAGIGNGVTMLLGTVRNAVPLIAAGMAGIAMTAKNASLNASGAIGFSTKQYEAWGLAANKAGVNAQGLYSKMKELEGIKYEVLEYGSSGAAEALGLNLAQIGINDLNEFLALDPAAKVSAVFSSAYEAVKNGEDDWRTMAYKVGKVLGNDFQTIFEKSYTEPDFDFFGWINDYYSLANNTDTQLKKLGLQREAADMKAFFSTMKEFSDGEFGEAITPMFKALNEFFSMNKDDIKGMISDVASAIGTLADALTPALISVLNTATPAIKELAQALGNLVNKNWKEAGENLRNFMRLTGKGVTELLGIEDVNDDNIEEKTVKFIQDKVDVMLDPDASFLDKTAAAVEMTVAEINYGVQTAAGNNTTQNKINELKKKYDQEKKKLGLDFAGLKAFNFENYSIEFQNEVLQGIREGWIDNDIQSWFSKDSIQRVRDKIKQNATNDALNKNGLSAEQRAKQGLPGKVSLLPSSLYNFPGTFGGVKTESNATAVINQTITINGSNDVAFDVKQQAYRGAQEGLSQVMNAAQVRMQLMPGLV